MVNYIKDWYSKTVNTLRLINLIEKSHFVYGLSHNESRRLFKKSIFLVEIETFSFCNRKCWFCPNAVIDRVSNNIYLDSELYKKILLDLQSIDYGRTVSYGRYNEPLADNIILERISLARKLLPKARLHISTNGDYLTRTLLSKVYNAGLRNISIQVYLDNGRSYSDMAANTACIDMMKKIEIMLRKVSFVHNRITKFCGRFRDMDITMSSRNFLLDGVNRGGLVDIPSLYIRTLPCYAPFVAMYIDYNGSVMPCCNLRSDYKGHQQYMLSSLNLKDSDIFNAYSAQTAAAWRRKVIRFGLKESPCNDCHFREVKFFKSVIDKVVKDIK